MALHAERAGHSPAEQRRDRGEEGSARAAAAAHPQGTGEGGGSPGSAAGKHAPAGNGDGHAQTPLVAALQIKVGLLEKQAETQRLLAENRRRQLEVYRRAASASPNATTSNTLPVNRQPSACPSTSGAPSSAPPDPEALYDALRQGRTPSPVWDISGDHQKRAVKSVQLSLQNPSSSSSPKSSPAGGGGGAPAAAGANGGNLPQPADRALRAEDMRLFASSPQGKQQHAFVDHAEEAGLQSAFEDLIRAILNSGVQWHSVVEVLRRIIRSKETGPGVAGVGSAGGGEGSGAKKPRFADGIEEAGEAGAEYELQFYRATWKPPLDHWGTACELKLWMDPLGQRLWARPVVSAMLHDIKVVSRHHAAGQPAATVVPLALYTFQLYEPVVFAAWVPSDTNTTSGGSWLTLTGNPFLEEGEDGAASSAVSASAAAAAAASASPVLLEGPPGGAFDVVDPGAVLNVPTCVLLSPHLNESVADLLGIRLEAQRGTSPGLTYYTAPSPSAPSSPGAQRHVVFARYSNSASERSVLSPLNGNCLWIAPPRFAEAKRGGAAAARRGQLHRSGRRASAPLSVISSEGVSTTGGVAGGPVALSERLVFTPEESIPPGVLEYVYSRDPSEALTGDTFDTHSFGKAMWEVRRFTDDPRITSILERIQTLENKQAYDEEIAADALSIVNYDRRSSKHFYQAVSNILRTGLALIDESDSPKPHSLSTLLSLQRLCWKGQSYIISLSHASVKLVAKEDGSCTAIYERMFNGSQEQPYRLLNHTMRSIQCGQMKPSLLIRGFGSVDGEYEGGGAVDPFYRDKPSPAQAQWTRGGFDLTLGASQRVVERVAGGGWSVLPRGALIHQVKSAIYHVDIALKAAPHPAASDTSFSETSARSFLCYRGLEGVEVPQYRNGAVLLWAAFSSTSLDAVTACVFAGGDGSRKGAVFSVRAGRSTGGKVISQWSRFAREREMLFPANTWLKVGNVMSHELSLLAGVRGQSQLFELEVVTPTTVYCARVRSLLPRAQTAAAASIVFQIEEALRRRDGIVDISLASPSVGESPASWQMLALLAEVTHLPNCPCPVEEVVEWRRLGVEGAPGAAVASPSAAEHRLSEAKSLLSFAAESYRDFAESAGDDEVSQTACPPRYFVKKHPASASTPRAAAAAAAAPPPPSGTPPDGGTATPGESQRVLDAAAAVLGIDAAEMIDATLSVLQWRGTSPSHLRLVCRGKKPRGGGGAGIATPASLSVSCSSISAPPFSLDTTPAGDAEAEESASATASTTSSHQQQQQQQLLRASIRHIPWEVSLELRATGGREGLAVGMEGARLIAAALRMKVPLRRLSLRNNRIPSNGVAFLLEALRENPHVIEIECDRVPPPPTGGGLRPWSASDAMVCKKKSWEVIRSNIATMASRAKVWYDDQVEPAVRLRCMHHRSHTLTLNQLRSFGEKWQEIAVKALWDVVDLGTVLPVQDMHDTLDWVVHAIGREWVMRDSGPPNHLLLAAVRLGRVGLASTLLNAFPFDIEAVLDSDSHSALYYACKQKAFDEPESEQVLSRLVSPRLLRIQSKLSGYTPLHAAVHTYNTSVVESLLRYGADPNVHEQEGRTPLGLARCFGFQPLIDILEGVTTATSGAQYVPRLSKREKSQRSLSSFLIEDRAATDAVADITIEQRAAVRLQLMWKAFKAKGEAEHLLRAGVQSDAARAEVDHIIQTRTTASMVSRVLRGPSSKRL